MVPMVTTEKKEAMERMAQMEKIHLKILSTVWNSLVVPVVAAAVLVVPAVEVAAVSAVKAAAVALALQ